MIEGVKIRSLKKFSDERGNVMRMLREDDDDFERFGEIYFSSVYPGVVKGWHLHRKMTLKYACIVGMIKLVLFDAREGSSSRNELMELFIGEENYLLVTIPFGVWNGFKGLGQNKSIVANCANLPHDPMEIVRMDPIRNDIIRYNWDVVCG